MPRTRVISAVIAVVLGGGVQVPPLEAGHASGEASLASMPLPGGLRAALDALGDGGSEDHAQFLLEIIRRFHHSALRRDDPDDVFGRLIAHLTRAAGSAPDVVEVVPLPLTPALWIDAVFGGRASPDTLVLDILRSRSASLLYSGLLALDDSTRAWLAERPALLADIASASAPAFATAAPGFRVSSGAVRVPGGAASMRAWEAIVGRPASDPEGFLRAVLASPRGQLAYLIAAFAPLTDSQVALVLTPSGAGDEPPARRGARLLAVMDRLAPGWDIADRTFWRPARDPALMAAELSVDDEGRPRLPGTRAFWRLVWSDPGRGPGHPGMSAAARGAAEGEPVDFLWLAEQVFSHTPQEQDARYELVLFASRVLGGVTPDRAVDALDALRTAAAYPALRAALERGGISDAAAFAAAGRRAALLAGIGNAARAHRAHAQFQGALAFLTTSARRGALTRDALTSAVHTLSGIETSPRGDYEGRLVRWLEAHLAQATPAASGRGALLREGDAFDTALRDAIAGLKPRRPHIVAWEGMRYRVDLARAERVRLDQQLGAVARPYASAALGVVQLADAADAAGPAREDAAASLRAIADRIPWDDDPALRIVAGMLRQRAAADARVSETVRRDLLVAADELLGRGLLELTYAAALGHPDRTPISAVEAAARHDFGSRGDRRPHRPWQFPVERADVTRGWQIAGSLLGLDVRLAPFALIAWSPRPPPRRPSLNEQDRRVFVETVALVDSARLTDADRDAIVAAMARGRVRLAALRSAADAVRVAADAGLSPARRALLPWTAAHYPESLSRFLSPGELLVLGLDGAPPAARLHAWGVPGRPRLGCHCLRLVDRPWEVFAGRWNSGMFASAFPDLNLRIAELLAELEMPASLLGPVLAPAVLDFVNLVISRHPDDRRGLLDFVRSLQMEDVEQYLALLTTDGPLVVVGDGATPVVGFEAGAQP